MKIEIHGRLYVDHPSLGWLLLGSWGWQPIGFDPRPEEERV